MGQKCSDYINVVLVTKIETGHHFNNSSEKKMREEKGSLELDFHPRARGAASKDYLLFVLFLFLIY